MRPLALTLALLALGSCGGSSPTTPTPPATTETRIIRVLGGPLNFGNVDLGQSRDWNLQIVNDGNAPLTVTGMTVPSGSSFSSSFTSGTVAANGGVQAVIVRFTPQDSRSYNGTLTVVANHTSGTNTATISATGVGPIFTRTGTGNQVFDMPSSVSRVHVTARITNNSNCQNFIMRRNSLSFVNVILGTCSVADSQTYDGTHQVSGGVIDTVSSEGVTWTVTELR